MPYTVYTTGIMYRADRVTPGSGPNGGYDMLWDATNKGKAYIIDDNREALVMAMLRGAMTTDVNTEDPAIIDKAQASLAELVDLVNIKLGIQAYSLGARGHGRRPPVLVR